MHRSLEGNVPSLCEEELVRAQHTIANQLIKLTTILGKLRKGLPTFRLRTRQIDIRLKTGDLQTRAGVLHFAIITVVPELRRCVLRLYKESLASQWDDMKILLTYCPMVCCLSAAPQKISTPYVRPSARPALSRCFLWLRRA